MGNRKAVALLVIGIFLLIVSGVFAYATAQIVCYNAQGGSHTTPDGDTLYWDNFTIPPSKSIGPVGTVLISGASGVLGVSCIVYRRRKCMA
jgi:hypothetical protein